MPRDPPLSCCAQSQHPEMPVERSEPEVPGFRDYARNDTVECFEPGVPGFRDYARNDEVEDPTLCGEHRDVTLRVPLPYGARAPVMLGATPCRAARTPLSCCAQSQHPEMPVERSEPEVPGFRDYARNDEVEDSTLCGQYLDVTLRPPVMLRAVAASRNACRTL